MPTSLEPSAVREGLRNVVKLVSGTAIAQAIALISAPVLSRLFAPEEYGAVGVFLSFASVVGVVVALRLELAVVVAESEDEATDLVGTALLVVLGAVILAVIAVLLGSESIANWLGEPSLKIMLSSLPLYVGGVGIFQVFNYWATRFGYFGRLATAHVGRGAGTATAQIAAGYMGNGSAGLLAGHVIGQVLGVLSLLYGIAVRGSLNLRSRISIRRAIHKLRRYKDFVVFGSLQALLNSSGQGLPAILLTASFGASSAGQYLLAQRMITAPSRLIGQSVRQVVYPMLSRLINEDRIIRVSLRLTLGLAVASLGPVLVLGAWGPELFSWVFGSDWRIAGEFARFLVIVLAAGLFNIPAVSLVPILRMQRWHAAYEAVYIAARLAALVAGGYWFGPVGAIAAISFTSLGFNILLIMVVFWRLRRHLMILRAVR